MIVEYVGMDDKFDIIFFISLYDVIVRFFEFMGKENY